MTNAYVIFENSYKWYLNPLRENYRHVSVVVKSETGPYYTHIDPRGGTIGTRVVTEAEVKNMFDKALYYDIVIVETKIRDTIGTYPLSAFTCVELVKRILGIRSWITVTPYQLYRYLVKNM